ncbi:MAG: methionine--tRNA ligase [Erysipelotrichaceae bacterium]|nr:methionine--tRNA ligase [Erysipelotrichaceae bacterium]
MNKEKYYLTTAIAYTSGKPHIGNTYEIVLADAIARFKRNEGYDVYFQTGTDEHGQKIEDKAKDAGKEPKEFVDEVSTEIKHIFDLMNTKYDNFVRTTDPYHEKQVQKIFKKLYQQNDIYKGEYEGWYCKACESFFTESQLKDHKCPDCNGLVHKAKEEAYFLKMSKYADRLMEHIEKNPQFIQPESRKNEMVNNFIKPGLQDLCVSRTSFKWGIPVDFDDKHVVYVWIDALSNYITGLGFDLDGNHGELYQRYWPADVHLIGKDILRFHTIYWPIILMALDLPLPKQIFGHPWLLVGEGKMSKSKGNVIYADDLVEIFGVDAVRYIMLHEMPFAQDGTITYELIIERFNSDLANVLGNLVNRVIAMSNKYFNGNIHNQKEYTALDYELINQCLDAKKKTIKFMNELRVADSIDVVFDIFRRCNKYIDENEPWKLAKDENQHQRLMQVLYNLIEAIRFGTTLLNSFLPDTADKILNQLGTNVNNFESLDNFGAQETYKTIDRPVILFQRLDENVITELLNKNKTVPIEHKSEIDINDFNKIEMSVGEVISCKKHPKADKLLIFKIKINEQETRQIVSGLADYYKPEDTVGKHIILCTNLKEIKLRGEVSKGMILTAENNGELKLLETDMPIGSIIK